MLNKLIVLIATGGPGASRLILLSLVIYLFGSVETANFNNDFFIVLILNALFCQSYSFFLYKDVYANSLCKILKSSMVGVILALSIVSALFKVGLVYDYINTLLLYIALHIYFILRIFFLSKKCFKLVAATEILFSVICFTFPVYIYYNEFMFTPTYSVYIGSLFFISAILALNIKNFKITGGSSPKSKEIINIAASNASGPYMLLIAPVILNMIGAKELVSLSALAITVLNVIFLIPRAYANTFLPELGKNGQEKKHIKGLDFKYFKVAIIASLVGFILAVTYIYFISASSFNNVVLITVATTFLLLLSQSAFVTMTFLNLNGYDKKMAIIHIYCFFAASLVTVICYSIKARVSSEFIVYGLYFCFSLVFLFRGLHAKRLLNINVR